MDDTFAFEAARRPRRIEPRAVKAGAVAFAVVLAVGLFARWVIESERASVEGQGHVEAFASVGLHPGADAVDDQATGAVTDPLDASARAAARGALRAATAIATRTGSIREATPARLAERRPDLTFTDGPSLAPSVISVAITSDEWAAATMSDTGTCFYVRLDKSGAATYGNGSGTECVGSAGLAASDVSW